MTDQLYVKVFVNIVEHPKMLSVPRASRWAFIDLLCYCKRNLTDGFVPAAVLDRIEVSSQEIAALMWSGLVEDVGGGYQIHDFTDWQTPKELIERRREAGRRGGLRSGMVRRMKQTEAHGSKQTEALASREMKQRSKSARSNEPETETETETEKRGSALARRDVEREREHHRLRTTDAFDAFWNIYPRKVGKRNAQTAYANAIKRATEPQILDGLRRLIPTWTEPRFIPHPATWLNRDGWDDEPAHAEVPQSLVSLADDVRRYEEGQRFFG